MPEPLTAFGVCPLSLPIWARVVRAARSVLNLIGGRPMVRLLIGVVVAAAFLTARPATAQKSAGDDVKKLQAELKKLQDQVKDVEARLKVAQEKAKAEPDGKKGKGFGKG